MESDVVVSLSPMDESFRNISLSGLTNSLREELILPMTPRSLLSRKRDRVKSVLPADASARKRWSVSANPPERLRMRTKILMITEMARRMERAAVPNHIENLRE
jgi:hypothetical protein